MSIDERLDRLTERHEALTQTVELVAGMQRENEERFARNEERFARTEARLAQLMDTMNRLANIIIAHEQRLEDLENR